MTCDDAAGCVDVYVMSCVCLMMSCSALVGCRMVLSGGLLNLCVCCVVLVCWLISSDDECRAIRCHWCVLSCYVNDIK